ncbi:Dna2-domain-containing protein [Ganoderma leucocontextum]|nr:Dna2-domain-containing protein [Ganoderma leucocontextum]
MPPSRHSEAEESNFLDSLFLELDSTTPIPHTSPTRRRVTPFPPPRTPVRANRTRTPSKKTPNTHVVKASNNANRAVIHAAESIDIDALLDGAEDWDWDDMNSDFMTPRKSSPVKPKRSRYAVSDETTKGPKVTRCTVRAVEDRTVKGRFEKVLEANVVPSKEPRRIILRDDWAHADVRPGDVINAIGECSTDPSSNLSTISVCSKHNYLIHHPDILLTATSLSNASHCSRRPLLANMVRSSSDVTPSLVWGNVLHEVMQTCLSVAKWDDKFINKQIAEVAQRGLGELLRINMGMEQAIAEVKARAKGLRGFADKYIAPSPKVGVSQLSFHAQGLPPNISPEASLTNTRAGRGEQSLLAISQLYDIEETSGLRHMGSKGRSTPPSKPSCTTLTTRAPHSLVPGPKSGRARSQCRSRLRLDAQVAGMEHRAQTMLYTLLMGERYGTEVPSGLLYYTQSEEVVRVPAARNELRALLVARNELAGHMMSRLRAKGEITASEHDGEVSLNDLESFLPPTIDDNRTCGKCFALDTCMLYRKAVEGVEDTTSDIADIYALKTGHLTPSQAAFFKKWEALISLEEKDLVRFRRELWTMTAPEREEKGRCFSDMVLDLLYRPPDVMKPTSQKEGKIHRLTYRFVKAQSGGASLLSGHTGLGDAVVVSVEPGLLALARGFVVDLAPDSIVLGVDHELDEEMILDRLRGRREGFVDKVVFRIDKDEMFGGMARIRDNLAQLFYAGADSRMLELVVDLAKPRFSEDVDDHAVAKTAPALSHLNKDQRLAVRKVLHAEDYALILGMPGTGKTTVIAAVISQLVEAGKTVLLSSYTHSAVDNILMKLNDANFDVLRLGNLDKIHPAVQHRTLAARPLAKTIEQLEHQVMSPPVVATTCLSIDHPLFSKRTFDYCIVDEASQITLPTCLGPLRFSKKFVLVGDHFQLPPLVKNRAARKGGLDVSLFRRLSDTHPEAVVDLTHQYRMNSDIMLLSNKLIYSNRLKCGSDAVASQSLKLSRENFLEVLHTRSTCRDAHCWMGKLMSESCKAVFVDTDNVPAYDSRVGDLVENQIEARLVHQVTECLLECGVQQQQIGVISLYRQQLKLLSYLLQDRKELEILTADRSQGRDKDCIIISMVRSNDEGQVRPVSSSAVFVRRHLNLMHRALQIGELVKDWRRMNVSFTRARSKLIIIGSRKTLRQAPLLTEFFELMDGQGWILTLPPDAHLMHDFGGVTPRKRPAADMVSDISSWSNHGINGNGEKLKRAKVFGATEQSVLVGRPLLQDIVNDRK